ncbi:sec1 family domain-containing protein 2-like isoform X1 [Daktulosphaira vitifoliae]|uniref:sec1 family domain-containing protein 2-like isoform X1 n=2 Tax=Daktulosphaira vitifoliae TaxID=58002 RepID=UPI0021AAAC58|nr:sec1 family domain-containing protein 2-like isoform X1 [Daktulosphaira vitifoliae]XP_050521779.1 sec1 family domain-containing protein 2-like isoform X1 [Daktulosphaira vitifoliae]
MVFSTDTPFSVICDWSWTEVCKYTREAAVFLDQFAAESLHWHGGCVLLYKAGAKSIKEFSSFESGNHKERRCLIIVGKPIDETVMTVTRDVLVNSNFKYCCFIVGCGYESYHNQIIEKLISDIIISKYTDGTVDIINIPISMTCLSPSLFLIPHLQNVPLFIENDRDAYASVVATTLRNIFEHLKVKLELYCVGPYSEAVSQYFYKTQPTSYTESNHINIILIDRLVDMYAVTEFSSNCPLDKLNMLLTRFPGTCSDVSVVKEPLLYNEKLKDINNQVQVPICLASIMKPTPIMEWLLTKNEKELLTCIRNFITEKTTVGPVRKVISRITPQFLESLLADETFESNENIDFKQQVLCICAALKLQNASRIELAQNIEKLLLQNIVMESDIDILLQMKQLFQTRKDRKLSLEILLCILVQLYSIIDHDYDISEEYQIELQTMLGAALYEDKDILPEYIINDIIDHQVITHEVCEEAAEKFFFILNKIKLSRQTFMQYKKLYTRENLYVPVVYNSFVKQLMNDVCSPMRPNLSSIMKTKSDGITDLIKMGFNKIINSVIKHPLDCDHLIVFVLGGISGHEVQSISEATKNCGIRVSIGSTSMLSPYEALHALFKNC